MGLVNLELLPRMLRNETLLSLWKSEEEKWMFVEQFVVVMLPVDVWFVLYVVESFVVAVVPEEETGAVD